MPPELLTGRLSIISEPSRASIFLNSEDIETETPETISLPVGSHLITLQKKGFAPFSFCIDVIAGQTIEKKVELLKPTDEPIPTGKLKIESTPSHSAIYVNLEDTGLLTPETLQLAEGSPLITLKQDSGYDDESFCVEIVQDELLEKFIELKKATGELSITSNPSNAHIWLANFGEESKDTMLLTPEKLTLDPTSPRESITVTLRGLEGFENVSFETEIIKGKEIEKHIELVKTAEEVLPPIPPDKAGIKIISYPYYASIYIGEEDTGRITPELIILDPGDYEITVRKAGYNHKTVLVTLEKGKELEKFIELTKIEGIVSPDKSGVKLTSKPSAASIFISGGDTHRITPELVLLPPGLHQLILQKEGYENFALTIEIEEGKEIEKFVELTKIEGAIPSGKSGVRLTSKPSSASIFFGEEDTGRITPELIILNPGIHEITVKKGGYEDKTITITTEEGGILEKFIQLTKMEEEDVKKTGLKIISKPSSASIFIGEEDTGRITPEVIILDPETAEITFTLKKEKYLDRTVSVTIVKGEVSEKFVELVKTEDADKTKLRIVSTPSSASIFIGQKDTERITPESILLDPGTHELTLKKEGYENKTFFVTIEEGELQEKFIKLVKLAENIGELYITSIPRYAKVYVDGADTLLITPVLLSLTPATYNITLKRGGYNDVSFAVTVIRGQKIEKFIEFPDFGNGEEGKRIGQLRIESKPQHAEIWEGGSNLELLTPETLTLTPGTKSITLKKSGFDDYSFSIQIDAGEKSEKLCELTKSTGELFLQSRPSRAKIWIDDKDSHLLTPEKLILSPGTRRIGLSFPAFLDALFIVKIVKGGKIEKFHRFAIPRDSMISEDSILDSAFFYTKTRCMKCDESPEYDILFADGNIRAWLCEKHCTELVKEQHEKINAIRRIDNGKATNKFRENSNPNVLSRFIKDAGVVLVQDDEDLAPVYPSGNELGEKITRDEVLQHLKSFYRTKPYISLVGGICNRGSTTGDIDVFINSKRRDIPTEFRLIRMFPEKYWFRFTFHYPYQQKEHPGKFTNFLDIYDEKIEAIHNPEIVLMSVPKKVELFKFAPLLKPAHGRYKGEEYSIDKLIEVVNAKPEWYEKGTYVQKKFDGVHVRCDIQKHYESGYDVIIYSEEGNEISKNLPTLREELGEASKGRPISVVGELEFWEDKEHQSRQQITAIIHTKEVHPDEGKVILNVFDCLYFDKDIHNESYSDRLKSLDKIKDTDHIKKADYKLVDTPTELRKAVEHYSSLPSSEGAYLKRSDFRYELDGKSLLNLKYKNTFSIDAKVVDVHEVKDANAFNYLCVIEDDKGNDVPIGRTYNTSIKVVAGAILKVEFVNLSQYTDQDSKKLWFNWWSPRVIMAREDKTKPDNTRTALKLVIASKGTVAEKKWPKRYEGDDAPLTLHQNESFIKGKIVKVNDKIGIVSKIIGGG